jgi:hypothetical protein
MNGEFVQTNLVLAKNLFILAIQREKKIAKINL